VSVTVRSFLDGESSLADDVRDGLTRPFKGLRPKHFYDASGADFVPEQFEQVAFFDREHEWIEMRLRLCRSRRLRAASSPRRASATRECRASPRCWARCGAQPATREGGGAAAAAAARRDRRRRRGARSCRLAWARGGTRFDSRASGWRLNLTRRSRLLTKSLPIRSSDGVDITPARRSLGSRSALEGGGSTCLSEASRIATRDATSSSWWRRSGVCSSAIGKPRGMRPRRSSIAGKPSRRSALPRCADA
jgi:hypothetical protein